MTAEQIYAEMKDTFADKTGFAMADTADLAVRLYAAAAELETLYAYCDWAMAQSFPQTATGEYLDLHAALRGLTRTGGAQASGTLRFYVETARSQSVTVPAGTVCVTTGLVRYETAADTVITAGSLYADAPARAVEIGAAGNAAAGAISMMALPPVGVALCANPLPFTGGADEEDDDALRVRVLSSYARLPNGANSAFYEERARSHAGIGGVSVLPRWEGVGTVGVVIAGEAGLPDAALVTEVQDDLNAVREIAVNVTVMAPEVVPVDLSLTLWPADNTDFASAKAAAETALGGYFTGALLGKPIYLTRLASLLFTTGAVKNLRFLTPAEDVAITASQLPRLGTLTITEGI